jgi:hypothetical protein
MNRIADNNRNRGARWNSRSAILATACLLISAPAPSAAAADEDALTAGHGYVLIRFEVNQRQRISRFAFTHIDTKEEARIRMRAFSAAGASAWMALVTAPAGRYYWSEFEATYGISAEQSRDIEHIFRRSAPGSAGDTFEVVSGVVNYIGDWTMRVVPSERRRLEPVIQYDNATVERYVADYPQIASEYPIYLCVMGKAAISFAEMARIILSQPE